MFLHLQQIPLQKALICLFEEIIQQEVNQTIENEKSYNMLL